MHRVLALLIIPALMATSGVASMLHTHVYNDHDHPEHHHGLSAHEHHTAPSHSDDGVAHLEGCDPRKHAIPFAFVCAAPQQVDEIDAEIALPSSPTLTLPIEHAVRPTDVRVHGPPSPTEASPRAPPLITQT